MEAPGLQRESYKALLKIIYANKGRMAPYGAVLFYQLKSFRTLTRYYDKGKI